MAKRLLLLNGIAIVCVILFHATGFGFTAMFAWPHRYRPVTSPNYDAVGTGAYYALRLLEQLVVFSIPAFLFVSGYFVSVMTGRSRQTVDSRAIGARIRNLLIPYAFWTAVVLAVFALEGRIFPATHYLWLIATGATDPNYYYVPLLVQLYLLAPLLVLMARRNPKALLGAAAALQLGVYALQYAVVLRIEAAAPLAAALPKWFFPVHLFWFAVGVVAGLNPQGLRAVLERIRPVLLPALVLLFVAGVAEWELLLRWSGSPWVENRATALDGLYAGVFIMSVLAFDRIEIPLSSGLLALGARSYGIYLVHGLVMQFFSRGLYHFAPWVLGHQELFQPMLILLGMTVPVVLMSLVSRSRTRSVYAYVFG